MAHERWDPLRDMVSLRDAVSSLIQESFVRPSGAPGAGQVATLPLDVLETPGEFVVIASIPGAKPDDVQITTQGDTLSIRAEIRAEEPPQEQNWLLRERRAGTFQRSLTLAMPVNADRAQARFEDGVLTLTLPKAEETPPKQIKIVTRP